MNVVERLFNQWQAQPESRAKDELLASVLGDNRSGTSIPRYCTDIGEAQVAMDRAWMLLEESAPVRIACHVEGHGRQDGGRQCHVEWWPEDGAHHATPEFESEAESRAFAAFAFLKMEAGQT
ncbi:hypothetical protein [Magnetococcus sp. PR-3]|uniref:hypothetical protein n=1 Tax=Magnetococcus sp. PR-3 TaxID=3120355 RepID=UPI002FCDE456